MRIIEVVSWVPCRRGGGRYRVDSIVGGGVTDDPKPAEPWGLTTEQGKALLAVLMNPRSPSAGLLQAARRSREVLG